MEKVFFNNYNNEKICGILEELDSEKQEIIILVHGFSSSKEGGAKIVAEELGKNNINSLRIDLDDWGESEPKFENATITRYIETVKSAIDFCRRLGYKEVNLLGTSTGGLVVTATVLKYPEIKRLILRSPSSSNDKDVLSMWGAENLKKAKENGYIYHIKSNGLKRKIKYDFIKDGHKYTMYDKVKDIKIPTLIIQGTKDEAIPYKDTEKLAENFPLVTFELIKGADHSLGIDGDYTKSLEILIKWLRSKTGMNEELILV